jgi:AP endonuclease 1
MTRSTRKSTTHLVDELPVRKSPARKSRKLNGAASNEQSRDTALLEDLARTSKQSDALPEGDAYNSSPLSDPATSEGDSLTEPVKTTKRGKGRQPASSASRKAKHSPSKAVKKTPKKTKDSDTAVTNGTFVAQGAAEPSEHEQDPSEEPRGTKRKRKTQAEKEAEAMPLAARTTATKMFVGAHTSIAKGVENAITNAVHIGGNSFACFLKSQRKWDNPSLKDENRDAFKQGLITHKYDASNHIVPHGSYLVNLATEATELAQKSYDAFIDDLKRCEALGIKHYNFHPGAAGKSPMPEAIARLANNLNRALSETTTVIPLLENMAARGSIIGGRFEDLKAVIALIKPEHKSRIGVCIDTCHAFASGYDLRSPEAFKATIDNFDKIVGIKHLKALHINDSKALFGSNKDLHQNIGLGFLGLRAFHNVMNEPRFEGLPLILETPCDRPDPKDTTGKKTIDDKNVWAREIKLLESLVGMDPESDEFKRLEKELANEGKAERDKHQKMHDEKLKKEEKKLAKEREKGQKSVKDLFAKGGQKRGMSTKAAATAEESGDESNGLSELEDEDE